MDYVKKLVGTTTPTEPEKPMSIDAIRQVNKDWVAYGCEKNDKGVACQNLREAMKRLELPVVAEASVPEYDVGLGPAKVTRKPPTLVLRSDAEKQATCTKRCGVFGSVLASTLATTALSTNAMADFGVPDSQKEVVAQAGGAAAAVAAVALCSRLCEPGKKQKTFDAEGTFVLKGQYTYTAQDKASLDAFKAHLDAKATK